MSRCSSVAEQWFCKPLAGGSIPFTGSREEKYDG